MARNRRDPKAEELAKTRTLNEHPAAVVDAQFAASDFFDAADLVQVKYDMVRRVGDDGSAVNAAAASFGFSRQSYSRRQRWPPGGCPRWCRPSPAPAPRPQTQRGRPRSSRRAASGGLRCAAERWPKPWWTGSGSACTLARWSGRWHAGSPPGVRKAAERSTSDDGAVAGSAHADALAQGYEQLRERVLAGRPDGWRLGHAVLAGKWL